MVIDSRFAEAHTYQRSSSMQVIMVDVWDSWDPLIKLYWAFSILSQQVH